MLLEKANIKYISTLTHEGKVVLMATVVENDRARLYYTVKQDGFEDSALQNPNGSGWEAFKALELPDDRVGDASVEAKEQAELTDKQGKFLLRSIYNSAGLTAAAPVQLVSHDGHLYVFRQSTRGTLLVTPGELFGLLTDASGAADFVVPLPDASVLCGLSVYWQIWIPLDPGASGQGWAASNGLRMVMGH